MSAVRKLTTKCQVTIPKRIRDTLGVGPGSLINFTVNEHGRIEIRKAGARAEGKRTRTRDRFDRARGRATVKWRTNDLMRLLRSDE
jgi:AbrB family looped-hinge helix DNA binding protein